VAKNVSLYIHIPFCLSKCTYCDFYSVPSAGGVPDAYIEALLCEAAYRARVSGVDSWRTVYAGGGTPSILNTPQITRLFSGLSDISGGTLPPEVTVECNPSDVTAEKLAAFESAGVTRLSCGIQSFSAGVLQGVRRRSSAEDVRNALACIRRNWHGVFSADMISGLPGESERSFTDGLSELLSYRPGHVSLYSLTVEEGTPLGDSILSGRMPYDTDSADDMWIRGRDYLCSNGYGQYEVSNFCRDGTECAHNKTYWNQEDYLGCGSGATGTLYGTNGGVSVRETNTRDIAAYTAFWRPGGEQNTQIPSDKEILQPATVSFEFFMMGLRTSEGVCRETYEQKFGMPFPPGAERLFAEWQRQGRCTVREKDSCHFYALTKEGLLFLNEFLGAL